MTKLFHGELLGFSARLNPELVTLNQFVQAFFSDGSADTIKMAHLKGLRQDPTSGHMATHYAARSALSNLAIKFNFCHSGAHCIPRDIPKHLFRKIFPYSKCDVTNEAELWDAVLKAAKNSPVEHSVHLK